jgi:hypothetical protein
VRKTSLDRGMNSQAGKGVHFGYRPIPAQPCRVFRFGRVYTLLFGKM